MSESGSPSGEGVPILSQPPHPSEENSNGSTGVLRAPEEPDLADKSSQSSITSQDDPGLTRDRSPIHFVDQRTFKYS